MSQRLAQEIDQLRCCCSQGLLCRYSSQAAPCVFGRAVPLVVVERRLPANR